MTFHVGQKVVCIDDRFPPSWDCVKLRTVRSEIYIARAVGEFHYINGHDAALWLAEIKNPIQLWVLSGTQEIGFPAWTFRPVVETDISVFTSMLKPSKVDA